MYIEINTITAMTRYIAVGSKYCRVPGNNNYAILMGAQCNGGGSRIGWRFDENIDNNK